MSTQFKLYPRAFLGLLVGLLLGTAPLHAQLDTRLQTTGPSFLDLYQQSQNLVMKPEIVTVFDFSQSMWCVMFHPSFVNTDTTDNGTNKSDAFMTFRLMRSTVSPFPYSVDCVLDMSESQTQANGGTFVMLTGGVLVRPDGSLLTAANLNSYYTNSSPILSGEVTPSTNAASNVQNWIRSASHVRFTYNGKTFDVPICWTVLYDPADPAVQTDTSNTDVTLRKYMKMYGTSTSYPLKATLLDPAASNLEVEIDRSYRIGNTIISLPSTTPPIANGSRGITVSFPSLPANTTLVHYARVNNATQRPYYWSWVWNTSSIPQSSVAAGQAFKSGIPSRTRIQAVKEASFRTWAKYYNKVFWAYRFLKYSTGTNPPNKSTESASNLNNDSRTDLPSTDPRTTSTQGSAQRGWSLMTGNSQVALAKLSSFAAGGSTTLNSAMGNTMAQLNDPNSIFNDVETGTDKPVECRNTYVMLFTDGVPNQDAGTPTNTNTPYVGAEPVHVPAWPATYGTANTGNAFFTANKTRIDTANATPYFNIINLAGLAAHGGETTNGGMTVPTYPATNTFGNTGDPLVSAWIPFWIKQRGSGTNLVTFTKPRAITTMTIGLSLAGVITDATSPKRRLFYAAVVGEPSRLTWDAASLTPFTLADPNDPTLGKTPNSVFFFDAVDPATLVNSLDAAFNEAAISSNINSTANPNLPFIGGSFGKQVYLGKFRPPLSGNVIWPGDLYMFATQEIAGQTYFLNKLGVQTTTLDGTTAQWAASTTFLDNPVTPLTPRWTLRKLFTRIPGTLAVPEPGLTPFSDVGYNATLASEVAPYKTIQPFVAVAQAADSARRQAVQFSMGGDITKALDASGRPTLSRTAVDSSGNITTQVLGDIIDSSPTAVEYNWSEISVRPELSTNLKNAGTRFRLILVGTNQGWIHAFGEVSMIDGDIDPVTTLPYHGPTKGKVEELWAFMPTDFLARLDYLTSSKNPHRFMVDGTPIIYHLDLPPAAGGPANGVVDFAERTLAIFGLRKGGRSYYALDIHDPFAPSLKWSLVPDEAAFFPTIVPGAVGTRLVTGGPDAATVKTVLGNFGFSTCTPALGRIQFQGNYRDGLFLGGGFSVPEIEANFSNVKLGRSVMALDVWTGQVLAAVDLTNANIGGSTVGPVVSGLVPFEFIVNSGMAQRAYFNDFYGGLWAWGSKKTSGGGATDPFNDFRMDTSDLSLWTTTMLASGPAGIRKVAQDGTGVSALYWNLPAPFRIGSFPGRPNTSISPTPAAVGIAMVSGDRNSPLSNGVGSDYANGTPPAPVGHRMTVVFDRQDSRAWNLDTANGPDTGILDSNLVKNGSGSFTAQNSAIAPEITLGDPKFYLAPYTVGTPNVYSTPNFGYYMNFPGGSVAPFIKKGVSDPMVVAGSLFYSYFDPISADPCNGGSGFTSTVKICDVIYPIANDSRTTVSCQSGIQFNTYVGIASAFTAYGTRGVLQAGSLAVSNPPVGASATTPTIDTFLSRQQERFPKVRVWRTVR